MKTVRDTTTQTGSRYVKPLTGVLLAGLVIVLAACATSRQSRKNIEESGFLGDYSQLEAGKKGQAALIYWNIAAEWKKYTKVKIDPIQIWKADDADSTLGKLSPDTMQKLVNMLHTSLQEQLANDYEIVDIAGPDTLEIRVAITDAKHAKPVIGLVSAAYLPLKVVSLGKQLITGTAIGVGAVTVEAEILDSQTHQRLAAAVDQRTGTSALRSKFGGYWGDCKLAFDWWATRLRTRLTEEREGVADKTDI